uniref:Uncharacterized protein n=1 Tax=Arundo donax TaxID=35708 RepID=A0A0A8YAN0_ARUDO
METIASLVEIRSLGTVKHLVL